MTEPERTALEFSGLCDWGCKKPARIRYQQTIKGRTYPTALLCEDCDREHWASRPQERPKGDTPDAPGI